MEVLMRTMFQSLGKNHSMNKLAKRYGLRMGAARFVAGDSIESAINTCRELNAAGKVATLDHLGEFVYTKEEAAESTDMCVQTLHAIAHSNVNSNLSLKMTSLGLDISKELCMDNMRRILEVAKMHGIFVRIDMEDYAHCQQSLDIYKELRKDYDNVGIVIQAYLYRTQQDIKDLNQYQANLRLVKGAYKESPEVAFPAKKDVDENLKEIIKMHLENGNYTAVASHDEAMIDYTKELVKKLNIPKDQFEFQMLYGICVDLQDKLIKEGYKVRVYVPYGVDWFGYFMRRLAERPANVWFVLKNFVK
ncbi:proline dehydrogenase [Priestia flexa]|uniref:proline dehydrogenase family protein n=1 Tax=Priestia flexa TaxID=86664 RepID=UPI000C238C1B|nr:proline dehydrogenase [Priestia flexa]MCM3065299.1 proline dehydrogenase [Priestia flexa]MEC0666474.1 proline dehydrogenase [Priestia flexa]MED3824150.1 proline dehydrogenase [Priestia flexa]WEZ10209.1 proline dehydrogenase [Priestia flexa]WHX81019.1 proline dehydrogenase [Priestia flexa]